MHTTKEETCGGVPVEERVLQIINSMRALQDARFHGVRETIYRLWKDFTR